MLVRVSVTKKEKDVEGILFLILIRGLIFYSHTVSQSSHSPGKNLHDGQTDRITATMGSLLLSLL